MKIFDTSSIVCLFREARCPEAFDICKKHGYELGITKQVYEELKDNPETFSLFQSHNGFVIIEDIHEDCISKLANRYPWMHAGELSVVCAGINKKNNGHKYHCIIDEKARSLKDVYGLKINGTIGMLMWQKNQINELTSSECEKIYYKIKESPFWIKDEILRGLLK
ncbi:hypothetical protein [uncultured Methanolobus sp.]|uniref:hypothetical protein n=1 Tax=uncultured Methanolobus sp. TaxID=218300 RepID=UPI002AABC75F|nr:hypothetical protein [uncultured Methanolobus sp.]